MAAVYAHTFEFVRQRYESVVYDSKLLPLIGLHFARDSANILEAMPLGNQRRVFQRFQASQWCGQSIRSGVVHQVSLPMETGLCHKVVAEVVVESRSRSRK